MSSVVYMCAIVLLAAISQATNIIKGLYCQDPDSGNLYPVNTTWPSKTFCGNYTCKLRKRNTTETQYTPIQKIDITKFHIPNEAEDMENDMRISASDNSVVVTKKTVNYKQPIFHKDYLKTKDEKPIINSKDSNDNDRYLTESEIKTITDMLYTIKKSDLEAIIDIYNLAQEIYKEIDIVSNEKLVKDPKYEKKIENIEIIKNDKQSYWYDPVNYHSKLVEMSREESKVNSNKKLPLDSNPTFFKGPLSNRDFGKLPYYYPISNFQRLSSYTHSKPNINDLEKAPSETKPCSKAASKYNSVALPGHNAPMKKTESIATVRPSTLLPYPFSYIYHYNASGYPFNYYYNYPMAHVEYTRNRSYAQPYYGTYVVQIPNYGTYDYIQTPEKEKSESINSKKDLIDRPSKSGTNKMPLADWQTAPLSDKVLEEVRAYIEKPKSHKPIPLKKNIKLERVGKVIKLDELTRKKREVDRDNIADNNDDAYVNEMEAYIERTICEEGTEPGYFRIGNLSQPYPACCPQKLDSIHMAREVIKID